MEKQLRCKDCKWCQWWDYVWVCWFPPANIYDINPGQYACKKFVYPDK